MLCMKNIVKTEEKNAYSFIQELDNYLNHIWYQCRDENVLEKIKKMV